MIHKYQIVVSFIILLIVPVGYVALRLGCDAPSVFYITIVFSGLCGFVRFLFCRKQIGYSLRTITKSVLLPVTCMTLVALPLPIFAKLEYFKTDTFMNFLLLCLISIVMTFVSAWFVGLNATEKGNLLSIIKSKIHKG